MRKFRDLMEAKDTIVFAFGRFNPPTTGHEKLIQKVASVAGSNPYRIYPSFTTNPKKDPLPHALKVAYMRKMFKKYARNIIAEKDAKTAIMIAEKLYKEGFKNLVMVAGSDRIKEFSTLLNRYNDAPDKKGNQLFKFDSVDVISAGERDPDSEGVEGMSASKMRAAASDGDIDSFLQGVPSGFADGKKLYRDVRKYMGIREERDMGDMTDFETLRDAYLTGKIWNIGNMVEANGLVGEVVRKGTNYLSFMTEDGKVHKAWLHEINEGVKDLPPHLQKLVKQLDKKEKELEKKGLKVKTFIYNPDTGKPDIALDERNYSKEYANYHSRPEQIARRSSRNKARRVMGDKTKIGMDVGHKDNDPMNNDPTNLRNEDPSKNRREPRLREVKAPDIKKGDVIILSKSKRPYKMGGMVDPKTTLPAETDKMVVQKITKSKDGRKAHLTYHDPKKRGGFAVYIDKMPDFMSIKISEEVELDEAKDHRPDYETFVKMYAQLNKAMDDASGKLKQFPRGAMGMTPVKVKNSPEYKKAKAEYEKASNLTKKFLKGVPKDFLKKNAQSRRSRREEVELDEEWWNKVFAKISQMTHPKGYGKMVQQYAELMKQDKFKKRPNMAADEVAGDHAIRTREFIKYINKLVAKKVLPQELKAEYQREEWSFKEFVQQLQERELSDKELKRREEIAKDLSDEDFKKRYGDRWKEVKMGVATKMAKNEQDDPCWDGYKQVGMKKKNGKEVPNCVPEEIELDEKVEGLVNKSEESGISYSILKKVYDRGMAAWNTSHRPGIGQHQWAFARVNSFISGGTTRKTTDSDLWKQHKEEFNEWDEIEEAAEYQGKKVTLNKPFYTPDGPKKSAVYVNGPKDKVVIVRFGDPNMEIKKDDPERRKSFRARHGCDNPGPKWKAKYWSCKAW